MSDLNQCTFTGRLGADPEIRRTQDGRAIANLRIACSDQWRDKNSGERKESTEWISVTIFNDGLCKVVEQYLKKGSKLLVQGQWKTRKWTDQAGNDRYSTECVLQGFDAKMIMLDGPSADKPDRSGGDYDQASSGTTRRPAPVIEHDDMSDEIPF